MATWYCGSTKWSAATPWAANTAYNVGDLRRQLATPTVGNERVFRCTTAGTSHATTEPTWTLTKGGTTNDNTVVWTEVTGNSTYGWGAAHARVANAIAWKAAGDDIYLSQNHAETQTGTITWAFPGTAAALSRMICVNDSAAPPTAIATGATTTTTTTGAFSLTGFAWIHGVGLVWGSGGGASQSFTIGGSATFWAKFSSCALTMAGTNAGNRIVFGSAGANIPEQAVEFESTTVKFGAVGQGFRLACPFSWKGGGIDAAGSAPTLLFLTSGDAGGKPRVTARNLDLSALGSGKALVNGAVTNAVDVSIRDCKLGSSVALVSGAIPSQGGLDAEMINSDSADTNYRYERQCYQGTEVSETTVVRTGGASDGVTTVSRKITTTADAKIVAPYRVRSPIYYWNTAVGSPITISIPIVSDGETFDDAEAWLEAEGLTTSGFPLGGVVSGRVADLIFGTPTNHPTDSSSSWGGSLSSPVKQTLSVTITPQEVGLLRIYPCVAKPSATVYYDPKALTTSGRQYMGDGAFVNERLSPRSTVLLGV